MLWSMTAVCHLSGDQSEYVFSAVGIPLFKSLIELFPEAQPLLDGVLGNYHEVWRSLGLRMLFMSWCACIASASAVSQSGQLSQTILRCRQGHAVHCAARPCFVPQLC